MLVYCLSNFYTVTNTFRGVKYKYITFDERYRRDFPPMLDKQKHADNFVSVLNPQIVAERRESWLETNLRTMTIITQRGEFANEFYSRFRRKNHFESVDASANNHRRGGIPFTTMRSSFRFERKFLYVESLSLECKSIFL